MALATFAAATVPATAPPARLPPTLVDIVEARSIDSLSVSPDGVWIAYRIVTPSVARDRTTVQWVRTAIADAGNTVLLGGESEPARLPEFDIIADGVSRWSPNSTSLFVLQQDGSEVQVHRLEGDGSDTQITHDDADIATFDLAPDGRRLIYQVRNPRAEIARAQRDEERTGLHFDRSLFTEGLRLTRNFKVGARETTIRRGTPPESVDLGVEAYRGELRSKELTLDATPRSAAASASAAAYIDVSLPSAESSRLAIGSSAGIVRVAKIAPPNALALSSYRVEVELPDGSFRACDARFCSGMSSELKEVTVDQRTGEAVILFEKDFSARSGLYGWNPRTGRTRTIVAPTGSLSGGSAAGSSPCPVSGRYLLCVQAGPTMPQRLVRIDLATGALTLLAEPNAVLAAKRFAAARYVEWHDASGRPANGVLMIPDQVRRPAPLVITTYRCRGFLRGGIAMVVPEHILTQMGFVSLCVNNYDAALLERDGAGQRRPAGGSKVALEAYRAIVATLAQRGIVDPHRVGIAGHSFSANSVAYAISHSDLFAAAVMSGGTTLDPASYEVTAPTADSYRKGVFTELGLPRPTDDPRGLWNDVSPALNARNIHAALLMQPPENEWLFALQLYTYIQDAGGTVDMYIYPNEGHEASREAQHQYWRNKRSLDWFGRWLLPGSGTSLATVPNAR